MSLIIACSKDPVHGIIVHAVDDIDALPPDILSDPKLKEFASPIKFHVALNDYLLLHQDKIFRDALVIVNTSKGDVREFKVGAWLDWDHRRHPDESWGYDPDALHNEIKEQEPDALEERFDATFNTNDVPGDYPGEPGM